MPRTKITVSKTNSLTAVQKRALKSALAASERDVEEEIDRCRKEIELFIDETFATWMTKIPKHILKTPLDEIDDELFNSKNNESKSGMHNKSKKKFRRSSIDDGYLTAGSSNGEKMDSHQKSKRRSRSCMGLIPVTPKFNINKPQIILRRPDKGEVALSTQGSPLLVNAVLQDEVANLNIPLKNGKMLTLRPAKGLRESLMPTLDDSILEQLRTLEDHINTIKKLHKK